MTDHPGHDQVDGGWWPQSRDLAVEMADLVDHFPARFGGIVRALASPPDWDTTPRLVPVAGRYMKVGAFPRDDTHLMLLTTSDRRTLYVLVVPPGFTEAQGYEALRASARAGNNQSAVEILRQVTEPREIDPIDHWSDDGGS